MIGESCGESLRILSSPTGLRPIPASYQVLPELTSAAQGLAACYSIGFTLKLRSGRQRIAVGLRETLTGQTAVVSGTFVIGPVGGEAGERTPVAR